MNNVDLVTSIALTVNLISNFVIGFFVMLDRRQRVGMEAIEKLEQDTNKKLDALRDNINGSHKKYEEDIVRLHVRIDDLVSLSSKTSGSLERLVNQVYQLNEHLLNHKK